MVWGILKIGWVGCPTFSVPGNKKEEWLKQFTLKDWEERATGNMLRRTDCKHEKERDEKWPTFLFSFLTCVQKQSNLIKLRVLKELLSIKKKILSWKLSLNKTEYIFQVETVYLHTWKLQNSLTVLLSSSLMHNSGAVTGPPHPQTGPATELVSTTENIFFLTPLHFFCVQEQYLSQLTFFLCATLEDTVPKTGHTLIFVTGPLKYWLRKAEHYFSNIYQVYCPEHCRRIETSLWAWLDHITDSLNNIWKPLAKTWPIQVTSYCNLFHLLEG